MAVTPPASRGLLADRTWKIGASVMKHATSRRSRLVPSGDRVKAQANIGLSRYSLGGYALGIASPCSVSGLRSLGGEAFTWHQPLFPHSSAR